MTRTELQEYLRQLAQHYLLDPLYIPRRFTALPESGSVSDDLQYKALGMLREREPKLDELLTNRAVAIVADPGGGKSVVGRAAIDGLIRRAERVPVFAEVKQYRTDLRLCFESARPRRSSILGKISTARPCLKRTVSMASMRFQPNY